MRTVRRERLAVFWLLFECTENEGMLTVVKRGNKRPKIPWEANVQKMLKISVRVA
jgi:hypothetical protein